MSYNKESVLHQIQIVQDNVNRLRVLVETDLAQPETGVPQYCCKNAAMQLDNISSEIEKNKNSHPDEHTIQLSVHREVSVLENIHCLCEDGNPVSNPHCPFHGRFIKPMLLDM